MRSQSSHAPHTCKGNFADKLFEGCGVVEQQQQPEDASQPARDRDDGLAAECVANVCWVTGSLCAVGVCIVYESVYMVRRHSLAGVLR